MISICAEDDPDDDEHERVAFAAVAEAAPPRAEQRAAAVCVAQPTPLSLARPLSVGARRTVDTVVEIVRADSSCLPRAAAYLCLHTPHELALRYTCPVFTLCDVVKLVGMSCKSRAELFARSLQSKLRSLDDSLGRGDDDATTAAATALCGTSFPPLISAHAQMVKRHSESDLLASGEQESEQRRRNADSFCAARETGADGGSDAIVKTSDVQDRSKDNDSDLFFDFDIGSPESEAETEEEEDAAKLVVTMNVDPCPGGATMEPPPLQRHASFESNDSTIGYGTKTSTVYGSAASSLCGDGAENSAEADVDGEIDKGLQMLNFDAQNWLKSNNLGGAPAAASGSSGATPVISLSPPRLASPKIVIQDDLETPNAPTPSNLSAPKAMSPEGSMASISSDNGDDPSFSFNYGDAVHAVASSKLNALLALLDQEKKPETTSSGRKKCLKSVTVEQATEISESGAAANHLSSSPVNFSFLSRTLPAQSTLDRVNIDALANESSNMNRCDSVPVLTSTERAFIESPKPPRKAAGRKQSVDVTAGQVAGPSPVEPLELIEEPPEPMRRSSSLKSGKTPPGTPGRRKIVRFADVFGLDLADVKTFLDEVPKVPKSAYRDLKNVDISDLDSDAGSDSFPLSATSGARTDMGLDATLRSVSPAAVMASSMALVPMFNQPGGMANFFDILSSKKVCLENAFMSNRFSVRGTIRVQNIGFEKGVTVRYTTNEWITYTDLKADYLQGSCDGFSDKFTFDLTAPSLCVGQRLLFCLRYATNCGEFWDNNDGPNYVFQCQSIDSSPSGGGIATTPVAVPQPHGRGAAATHGQPSAAAAPFSHSPSALSEEPWLRYL